MANKSDRLWYPRYPGDYARKTSHLTLAQHGAYTLLLDWYYSNSLSIPNDFEQIFRICVAIEGHEQLAVQFVLNRFFVLRDDGWHNERADSEITKKAQISEKRRDAQAVGVQNKLQKSSQNASQKRHKNEAFVPTTTTTATTTAIPRKNKQNSIDQIDKAFEEIWTSYPSRGVDGRKGAAFKGDKKTARSLFERIYKNTKEQDHETLIRNILTGCAGYSEFIERANHPSKHLSTWLNAAGWETDYSVSAPSQANSRRGSTYSLDAVHAQAMADQTYKHLREREGGQNIDIGLDTFDL